MEALTCYRVGEHLFENEKAALLFEAVESLPNVDSLCVKDRGISFTLRSSFIIADVWIFKNGEYVVFSNSRIYMTGEKLLEFYKRGISWTVDCQEQTFTFSNSDKENLVEDFKFVCEYIKEVANSNGR